MRLRCSRNNLDHRAAWSRSFLERFCQSSWSRSCCRSAYKHKPKEGGEKIAQVRACRLNRPRQAYADPWPQTLAEDTREASCLELTSCAKRQPARMFLSADGRALCLVLPFTPACGSLVRASEFCRQLRIARSASPTHLQHLHHRIDTECRASRLHHNRADDTPKAIVQAKQNRHESWLSLGRPGSG